MKLLLRSISGVLVILILFSLTTLSRAEINDLSRGQQIMLERGLQIQAQVYPRKLNAPYDVTGLDMTRFAESNFTTANFAWSLWPDSFGSPETCVNWGRHTGLYPEIKSYEEPYLDKLVNIQVLDEKDISDPFWVTTLANDISALKAQYPNVLIHTNLQGNIWSASQIRNFMQQAQPDMLLSSSYAFYPSPWDGGSPKILYEDLELYRKLGLEGYDGTGNQPIPTGIYTQAFVHSPWSRVVSESEIRLNNFAAWAFGCKFVDSFTYDSIYSPVQTPQPIMFTGVDDSNPTSKFSEVAETNRQSKNLGDALVRLVSTNTSMVMGQYQVLGIPVSTPRPNGVAAWSPGVDDPFITNITANNYRGIVNNGLRGDVVVGYFKPLDESLTTPGYADDPYFMIVNGLSDPNGSADDCLQEIRIDFDFGQTGYDHLLKMSRDTGEVEAVQLVHDGGSNYHLYAYLEGGTGDLYKYPTGGLFVSAPEPEPPAVHYTFRETLPGNWEVLVEVTGDGTAGLSAYEIWVDGVDPATISFDENVLATVVGESLWPVGFSPATLVQGDAGGSFNAGNYQGCGESAIKGIGVSGIDESGSIPGITPHVQLDVPALLGILNTEPGLTEKNFRVLVAGLLDELGSDFLQDLVVPTLEVIPLLFLQGDANGDGVVSAGDYAAVQANFGNTGQAGGGLPGDANGDGVVSAGDYAAVQANFGNTSTATVPEPATLCLSPVFFLIMVMQRRKK